MGISMRAGGLGFGPRNDERLGPSDILFFPLIAIAPKLSYNLLK